MALTITYTVVNTAQVDQTTIDLIIGLADEAFAQWGEVLAGDANISVQLDFMQLAVGRAGGTWAFGVNLGSGGGFNFATGAASYELMTGIDMVGSTADIRLEFDPDYLANVLFLDPTPETRDDIPVNKTDGLSVLLHEIGHALGFVGNYVESTGNFSNNYQTPYDQLLVQIGGETFLDGPNVRALTGGPLPLTDMNYTHYGNTSAFPGNSNDPLTGLMNGVVFYDGYTYEISDLDLAVLADTGLGTIRDDILSLSTLTTMRGGLGNDQIIGSDLNNIFYGEQDDDSLFGNNGSDQLFGGAGMDMLDGGAGVDILNGGADNDTLNGGSNVDTAVVSGTRASYTVTQTSSGVFEVAGADGTDTLSNLEFLQFDDQTLRLMPGTGVSVDFASDPDLFMGNIRDFDGNALGGDDSWVLIGEADVNGDGDLDQIFANQTIGRFAEVATAGDGLVYFDDHGWAGETRAVGIYIDPLVESGDVDAGGPHDSQTRFQNDLLIGNIASVLGADDYDDDGLQEVYFALTDGTAYLHAYMHADGNIQYANYQSEQQVTDYLNDNGYDASTYGDWFI